MTKKNEIEIKYGKVEENIVPAVNGHALVIAGEQSPRRGMLVTLTQPNDEKVMSRLKSARWVLGPKIGAGLSLTKVYAKASDLDAIKASKREEWAARDAEKAAEKATKAKAEKAPAKGKAAKAKAEKAPASSNVIDFSAPAAKAPASAAPEMLEF